MEGATCDLDALWDVDIDDPAVWESLEGLGPLTHSPVLDRAAAGCGSASGRPLRCLDTSHMQPCALCTAVPEEEEGGATACELVGLAGKKNGEKRLRSYLSRTPEWLNPQRRAHAADCAEPAGEQWSRLVASLRNRRAVDLRKADLLFLCRLWGYKSDIWRLRRQQARGAAAQSGLVQNTLALAPQQQLQPPAQLLAAPAWGLQTATDNVARIRVPAQRSAEAFGQVVMTQCLLRLAEQAPPHVKVGLLGFVREKLEKTTYARDETARMGAELRVLHATLQMQLMSLQPQDAQQVAWRKLAGEEPPIEPVLRTLRTLCKMAVARSEELLLPQGDAAAVSGLQYTLVPQPVAADETQMVAVYCGDPNFRAGGEHALEVLACVGCSLSSASLMSYGAYLETVSALTGVLIGQCAGISNGLDRHVVIMQVALQSSRAGQLALL